MRKVRLGGQRREDGRGEGEEGLKHERTRVEKTGLWVEVE